MHRAFQHAWILPIVAATPLADGHFTGAGQPDPTRFVSTQTIRPSTPPPQPDGPRRIEIKAGDNWATAASAAQPGDEIVLLDGVHRSATLEGLRGTATQPIMIRSADRTKLAEIAPDREGLKLVDCRHVRIERILVRNARRAGIVIEGSAHGEASQIEIADTLVVTVEGLVEQAGILVLRAEGVTIRRSRFENCKGSALRIEDSSRVRAERVQIRNTAGGEDALLLLGDCDELAFDDLWIAGPFSTALSIGTKDAPREGEPVAPIRLPEPIRGPRPEGRADADSPAVSAPPEARPSEAPPATTRASDEPTTPRARVRDASFTNILVRGAVRAIEIGSCTAVRIGNSTFVGPRDEVFRFVRPPKERSAAELRFHDNIVAWAPGSLKRFANLVEGASDSGLRLGPNLWWSEELPAALPLLGPEEKPFPGTVDVPQTVDIDPDLDDRGRPRREEAKLFGRSTS
jgi:hypothetical protein